MLVLKRRDGEKIVIGNGPDKITIAVGLRPHGVVTLTIDAPPTVPVWREELYHEGIDSNAKP